MAPDDLDKLAAGKRFQPERCGKVIDEQWVQASVKFDGKRLEYIVELSWGEDYARERFDKPQEARDRYNFLKVEHDLDE